MTGLPVVEFSAVILVDRRGWVLLQERDEFPRIDPEKWGLVGGHLDEGEDFESAAYRELAEECGVLLTPPALTRWGRFELEHQAHGHLDRLEVYAAATPLTDADIVLGEGRQIVFVDPATLPTLDLGFSATALLPGFLASDLYASMAP